MARLNISSALTSLLFVGVAIRSAPIHAEIAPCGLSSIQESAPIAYPPIAKAANVQGPVVLLAKFEQDGTVSGVTVLSAPLLLDQLMGRVAAQYVRGWKANTFGGPRECPISITFRIVGKSVYCGSKEDVTAPPAPPIERIDLQHVVVNSMMGCYTVNYSVTS
jgi:hypothetical protein